jgi:hypothetical protein
MRHLPKTALEVAALLPSTFDVVHTQDISTHHQITVRGESERAVMDALTVATRTLHETQVWVGAKLDGWRRNHQWQGTFILTDRRVPVWQRDKRAKIGDIVMTPVNVQAEVIGVAGIDRYDNVTVRENTPEHRVQVWRQGQLIVQREAR